MNLEGFLLRFNAVIATLLLIVFTFVGYYLQVYPKLQKSLDEGFYYHFQPVDISQIPLGEEGVSVSPDEPTPASLLSLTTPTMLNNAVLSNQVASLWQAQREMDAKVAQILTGMVELPEGMQLAGEEPKHVEYYIYWPRYLSSFEEQRITIGINNLEDNSLDLSLLVSGQVYRIAEGTSGETEQNGNRPYPYDLILVSQTPDEKTPSTVVEQELKVPAGQFKTIDFFARLPGRVGIHPR